MTEKLLKVSAKCGKKVLPTKLKFHEHLCSKCQAIINPANIPVEEQSDTGDKPINGSSPEQPGLPPSPEHTEPSASPNAEEALIARAAEKTVAILRPEIQAILDKLQPASMPPILSREEQVEIINQAVKETIQGLVEAQRQAGTQDTTGEGIEVPHSDGNDLRSIIRELAPLFIKKDSGLEQMKSFMSMMTEAAQSQIGIFRSGSDFASTIISAAAKLQVEPSVAADLVKSKIGTILPPREKNP